MSFFNKKEDVIEIQLTPHGKHLLSKGKFKPSYYAFYDDDIIYDSAYAGITELQNEIQQRIEDTPRLKTQYVFSERKAGLVEHIREDGIRAGLQETSERQYGLTSQLGNSSIGSSNAPAWRVNFLKGDIKSSTTHTVADDTNTRIKLKIPQIETESVEFNTQVKSNEPSPKRVIRPTGEIIGDDATDPFPDGSFVAITDDYLLLDVQERNVDFDVRNFDIEVFRVEAEGTNDETLIPLKFTKRPELIKDGILLDQPEGSTEDIFPDLDPTYVEYWFDIFCDSEISDEILCDVRPGTARGNIFTQDAPHCPDDRDVPRDLVGITEEEDEC